MDPHSLDHVLVGEANEDRFDGTLEVSPGGADAVQGIAPKGEVLDGNKDWVEYFVFVPVETTAT